MKQIAISLAFTLCITGCSFYKETNIEVIDDSFGCWVHIHTNILPTLEQTRAAYEKYHGKNFKTCESVSGIRFYVEGSGQGSYLIMRNPDRIVFTGTFVPRHRWNEAEKWGDAYCDKKDVVCTNKVTSDGRIVSDPIWGRDTPTFITP